MGDYELAYISMHLYYIAKQPLCYYKLSNATLAFKDETDPFSVGIT